MLTASARVRSLETCSRIVVSERPASTSPPTKPLSPARLSEPMSRMFSGGQRCGLPTARSPSAGRPGPGCRRSVRDVGVEVVVGVDAETDRADDEHRERDASGDEGAAPCASAAGAQQRPTAWSTPRWGQWGRSSARARHRLLLQGDRVSVGTHRSWRRRAGKARRFRAHVRRSHRLSSRRGSPRRPRPRWPRPARSRTPARAPRPRSSVVARARARAPRTAGASGREDHAATTHPSIDVPRQRRSAPGRARPGLASSVGPRQQRRRS